MNFGLLMPFQNPPRWARPYPEFYREQIEQIVRAEELGFDTIWLTEHHFDTDGWSPSLLPLAAGIATRTSRIRIGTFILILPFQNALRKEAGDLPSDRAMKDPPNLAALRNIDPTIPGGFPIVGTPEDCVRAVERYRQETRVTHLALGMHLPGLAPAKVLRSMELFAREVMPHFA